VAGAEQDAQGFAVAVGARNRQLAGVQAERGQDGEVGVDRVGFAFAAAGLAVGLFALEHEQARGGYGAGESDAVAAGAFDREGDAGSGSVLEDPGQQLGVAAGVVGDRAGGDRCPGGERDFYVVGVAVGVDTNDGVDEVCQHGHRRSPFGERSCRHRPG